MPFNKKWQTMEQLRDNFFVHLAAYANHVMLKGPQKVRNSIFNYWQYSFLQSDTYVFTSHIDKKEKKLPKVLINCSVITTSCPVFITAHCDIIRSPWDTREEKNDLQKEWTQNKLTEGHHLFDYNPSQPCHFLSSFSSITPLLVWRTFWITTSWCCFGVYIFIHICIYICFRVYVYVFVCLCLCKNVSSKHLC